MYNYYGYCPYSSYPSMQMGSFIRILHASPDAPAVDVYINNNLVASNLKYRQFTEYLQVPPGRYNVKVFAAGQRTNPVIDTEVNVTPMSIATVAAVGRLENIKLLPIPEPRMPIPPGKLYIRFGHLSPNAPRVDVRLPNGQTLFRNVGFEEVTDYIPVDPGTYTLEVFLAGTDERVLYVPNVNLQPNRFYTVYAVGLAGQRPPLQVLIPLDGNSYL
ncbi:DUF4397 domain-containing protein [Caldisalinibacter kiritimatiensis]|uniref:DUF4397 domain-containing protein n=1 Tax=Caldisalinibacter kiritimatiensis TaxID=1304284 RepID=R1ATR6_9FIRM|nr:DUF4397 domain-containing protein [Caldisalinibacter kiritimatiensis]EOD00488.1 hypothetical protein L21TH_1467 [Caldisalinibacter kiritimatiensis]